MCIRDRLWGVAYSTELTPTLTRSAVRLAGKLAQGHISAALDHYLSLIHISEPTRPY